VWGHARTLRGSACSYNPRLPGLLLRNNTESDTPVRSPEVSHPFKALNVGFPADLSPSGSRTEIVSPLQPCCPELWPHYTLLLLRASPHLRRAQALRLHPDLTGLGAFGLGNGYKQHSVLIPGFDLLWIDGVRQNERPLEDPVSALEAVDPLAVSSLSCFFFHRGS